MGFLLFMVKMTLNNSLFNFPKEKYAENFLTQKCSYHKFFFQYTTFLHL